MPVSKRRSTITTIVTVLLIAGALLWYMNRDKLNDDNTYYSYFTNANGIMAGAAVEVKGVRVGKIESVELNGENRIKVTLHVDKNVKLPKGTTARLRSVGMSGEKEMRLRLGGRHGYISDKGIITAEEELATLTAAGQIGATVRLAKGALRTGDTIINSINDLVGGVRGKNEIRLTIDEINKQTIKASRQSITIKGDGEKFAEKINSMDNSLAKAAANNSELNNNIAKAEKQSHNLAKSTVNVQQDLQELRSNLKGIRSAFAKADTGTLGKLLNDNYTYKTTTRSVDTLKQSLDDHMEYPAAYWFAIFGKNKKKE